MVALFCALKLHVKYIICTMRSVDADQRHLMVVTVAPTA
jgi:hypothetical protein